LDLQHETTKDHRFIIFTIMLLSPKSTVTGLALLIVASIELKPTDGFQLPLYKPSAHVHRSVESSLQTSKQQQFSEYNKYSEEGRSGGTLSLPDYLITDSIDLPDDKRPTILEALSNPREALSTTVMAIGTSISFFNVVGIYDDTYLLLESCAITLGILSSLAHLLQIKTGYLISTNIRRGIVDDAAINLYAALYSFAVSWLALRTSKICPDLLTLKGADVLLASFSIGIFVYSLVAPVLTLLADSTSPLDDDDDDIQKGQLENGSKNDNTSGNIPYQLSQSMVSFSRTEESIKAISLDGTSRNFILPPLSDTELLRARGLLFIGILGCTFAPEALSFLLGGQDWWGRVTENYPSQQTQESSTALFALFATESSMIAHRVGKVGVAKYEVIVPVFAGVCAVLAVVPCVCSLHWLGDDISFFSFYRE